MSQPYQPLRPLDLQVSDHELKILWNDRHQSVYPNTFLRERCPCAACIGEPDLHTAGRRSSLLLPMVRPDVKPMEFRQVGRYGVAIVWSDGHDTGIYTFRYLRELCQCKECQEAD